MNYLIITSRFGMGHFQAAQALAQEIKKDRENTVLVQDLCELLWPKAHRSLYRLYSHLVTGKAPLFRMVYTRGTEGEKKSPFWLSGLSESLQLPLRKLVNRTKPDVIISTWSLASLFLSRLIQEGGFQGKLVTCITDLSAHRLWVNDETDLYLVAAQETRMELQNLGVEEKRIQVLGIPVTSDCREEVSSHTGPVLELLLMGGGLGLLPGEKKFYEVLSSRPDFHITVICGRNKKLYRKLSQMQKENLKVIGYTQRVSSYLKKADVLITKPGGVTTFEAIHSETPMILLKPFMEQEKSNARFVKNHAMGVVLCSERPDAMEILHILQDPERINRCRRNMQQMKQELSYDQFPRHLQERLGKTS